MQGGLEDCQVRSVHGAVGGAGLISKAVHPAPEPPRLSGPHQRGAGGQTQVDPIKQAQAPVPGRVVRSDSRPDGDKPGAAE